MPTPALLDPQLVEHDRIGEIARRPQSSHRIVLENRELSDEGPFQRIERQGLILLFYRWQSGGRLVAHQHVSTHHRAQRHALLLVRFGVHQVRAQSKAFFNGVLVGANGEFIGQ